MTAKRFTINGKEIIQNKQVWCMANSEHCADVIATAMNELHEENQALKSSNMEYEDALGRLEEDNKKLKQVNEMLQMDFAMTERNLIEENNQLKNENEQLKSHLQMWELIYD